MKIKNIEAKWIHVPIPGKQQHVSDFGRITSFGSTLVSVDEGFVKQYAVE